MFGFSTKLKAIAGYLDQYDTPLFFGGITEKHINEFKEKINVDKSKERRIKK